MTSSDPPRPGPASWGGYDGPRGSTDSRFGVHFDEESGRHQQRQHHASSTDPTSARLPDALFPPRQTSQQELRRRRSSIADRVNAIRSAGGVNSIDNFARSYRRAAGFFEITPVRRSFMWHDGADDEDPGYERGEIDTSPMAQRSLLRAQLAGGDEGVAPEEVVEDSAHATPTVVSRTTSHEAGAHERSPLIPRRSSRAQDDNIFNIEPQLSSPFGGSYGSNWGSLASRVNEPAMRHAGKMFRQQQLHGTNEPDKEREPLLVRPMQDEDGKIVNVVVGQSTVPQTIFNSVNVLIGVGLLSLPLAMHYAGWLFGIVFMAFAALSTSYTAKVLAKCADVDNTLITFADLAFVSFGRRARWLTSILFSIELAGACVALIILFADSLDSLAPNAFQIFGTTEYKIACGVITAALAFAPLRVLSFFSILGIACTFGITILIFVDGLIKEEAPGSLRHPAMTAVFPQDWSLVPISFGLLMSPWGGHSVFPNIYRDMRHPFRYHRAVNVTYVFTFLLDMLMAVVGYLMFGGGVLDEVTRNITEMKHGYPHWTQVLITIAIAIIPITKIPLTARPIISTIEVALGLDVRAMAGPEFLTGLSGLKRGILKCVVRIGCTAGFVCLAIVIPEFETIMSLIGAVACFSICIVLPCAFHLKLFSKELSGWQKALDWCLIVVSSAMALVSTAFTIRKWLQDHHMGNFHIGG